MKGYSMAGITKVIVGEEVPISLQLPDGAADQYPRAEVRDEDGTLLATLNLSHVAGGLYRPASAYNMPDQDAIFATYIVYSDSGHTTESDFYLRDLDAFLRDEGLNEEMPASPVNDSLYDYIRRTKIVIVNKMEIDEDTGSVVIYEDDDSSIYASISGGITSDSTTILRKKME